MAATLAFLVMVVHFGALIYIGVGGFVAWRWPKAIFVHLAFLVWGVLINVVPSLPCPLTTAEDYFRHQQGLESLPGGFNAYYIYDHVFPRPWLPVVGLVWLSLVVVSYVGTVVLWRRRRAAAADPVSVG